MKLSAISEINEIEGIEWGVLLCCLLSWAEPLAAVQPITHQKTKHTTTPLRRNFKARGQPMLPFHLLFFFALIPISQRES